MLCIQIQRRRSRGGGQGAVSPPPPMKILGCNARIGLKSTVRHYKTIKFNIRILLNIHNFQFCGTQSRNIHYIATLCTERDKKFEIFLTLAPSPPPLQSQKWIDAPVQINVPLETKWNNHATVAVSQNKCIISSLCLVSCVFSVVLQSISS